MLLRTQIKDASSLEIHQQCAYYLFQIKMFSKRIWIHICLIYIGSDRPGQYHIVYCIIAHVKHHFKRYLFFFWMIYSIFVSHCEISRVRQNLKREHLITLFQSVPYSLQGQYFFYKSTNLTTDFTSNPTTNLASHMLAL